MISVVQIAKRFVAEEAGPTATEYEAMIALLVVALISTLTVLRDGWVALYTTLGSAIGV